MTELEKVPSTEAALGGVDSGWILKESGWTASHKVSLAENIIEEDFGTKATFVLFVLTIFLITFPSLLLVIPPLLAGILVSYQVAGLAFPVTKPRNPAKVLEAQVGSNLVSVTPISSDSHRPLEIRRDDRPAPEKAKIKSFQAMYEDGSVARIHSYKTSDRRKFFEYSIYQPNGVQDQLASWDSAFKSVSTLKESS